MRDFHSATEDYTKVEVERNISAIWTEVRFAHVCRVEKTMLSCRELFFSNILHPVKTAQRLQCEFLTGASPLQKAFCVKVYKQLFYFNLFALPCSKTSH